MAGYSPHDGSNACAVSYDGHGRDPMPVPYPCEGCGETWSRDDPSAGARYPVEDQPGRPRWLCACCFTNEKAAPPSSVVAARP